MSGNQPTLPPRLKSMRRSLLVTAILAALFVVGCGDDSTVESSGQQASTDASEVNVDRSDTSEGPKTEVDGEEGQTATTSSPTTAQATGSTIAPQPPPGPSEGGQGSADRPAQGVYGRVTGPGGEPIRGAMVQPSPGPGNPAPEREVFATTAADGTYGIGLSAGRWTIQISADGYEPRTLDVTVAEGGATRADAALRRA